MANIILLSSVIQSTIEIWRPIEGFPGYEVSSLGRVWSFRTTTAQNTKHGRERGLVADRYGYKTVRLHRNGYAKCCTVHRLVASAFLPNPRNCPQVNHINCIKTDNRVDNLQWCTAKENTDHLVLAGCKPKGEHHGMARLTDQDVVESWNRRAMGESTASIARSFNVTSETIGHIFRGNTWKHLSR